ncbi:MAG: HD domain-containing protein [Planctomycetes bacterium]|nr:HD domain-containing protein [Planctomycetota bacterium]MBU1518966.1 HD domain-containing protein [Planctomycetota bacterium]MBU2457465.1 HD domain-containing protein [Planctomycetota bacterium]
MTKQQLEQFKRWFYSYVAGFYGDDELTNDNIRLKEDHTRRMCADTPLIAEKLGLNQQQRLIAETISLLHDIGRFEQFIKYRTYNDVGTENHSLLGLKVLAENKILDGLDSCEKEIIETAIRLHGERDLPKGLKGEIEFFAKLIRDIDKLDIYYVMIDRLDDFRKNPEKATATLGFSEKDKYSKNIIQAVIKNRTVGYEDIKSLNDMVIAMLGWIFDINFTITLKEIEKRGLLDKLISFLPDDEDIREVARHIKSQLNERINAG